MSDTNSETSTPNVTTIANDLKNMPRMPSIKITGANIQTSEAEDASTANTTSLLPRIVALVRNAAMANGFFKSAALNANPASPDMWRKILSRTTIASSTTTPISNSKASKVMLLKV